jgi:hypothetical protein
MKPSPFAPLGAARSLITKTSEMFDRLRGPDGAFRVHIVCYEDVDAWILGKFAQRLAEHLSRSGIEVDISKRPDPRAEINHHIIYYDYDGRKTTNETVMVTHIDTPRKRTQLKGQLVNARMGVCMSLDTVERLAERGLPRDRLCFINPATDGIMKPRRFAMGITSKVQPSGCKREQMLVELAAKISPDDFEFRIMGGGWDTIVDGLRERGFTVEYLDRFDRERYRTMMPQLDYYLYFGEDEGSMGFVDALAAGIPTIVTPQGYHLDAKGGITHAFSTADQLAAVFHEIAAVRQARVDAVSSWTWAEYARKHLALWQWIVAKNKGIAPDAALLADLDAMGVKP